MSQPVPPPLSTSDARALLRQLGDLTESIVLVGGQALAFWVEHYGSRVSGSQPVNSQDIDFCGFMDAAELAAERLGGVAYKTPLDDVNTVSTALVTFAGPDGFTRHIDFLEHPFGLNHDDVVARAAPVELTVQGEQVTWRVMSPIHCLESRIANVGGLPGYQTPHALNQARASILCARESVRDRLDLSDADAAKAAGRMNERIYRFAWENRHAKSVFLDHGIDVFDAVLLDERLLRGFTTRRYPQMQRILASRRERWQRIGADSARRSSSSSRRTT